MDDINRRPRHDGSRDDSPSSGDEGGAPPASPPPGLSPVPSPFYPVASFGKQCVLALAYSAAIHAFLAVARPLFDVFLRRLGMIIEEEVLRPEDCFLVPAPAAAFHPTTMGPEDDDVDAAAAPRGESSPPIAVVTGSNTGVGFETASALVERGYRVILACRSREKGEAAAARINRRAAATAEFVPGGEASFLRPLDLSSLDSVRAFHRAFGDAYGALNVLVNNAGTNSQGVTSDGLESCFQTNFVGHFLLANLLLPQLSRATNAMGDGTREAGRVVNLSSVTHHFVPANDGARRCAASDGDLIGGSKCVHDEAFWRGSATPGVSTFTYRESKLAAILFTMELNKRFGERGIRSVAVNPGSVASDIWRDDFELMQKIYKWVMLSPRQGASTSVAGAIGNVPDGAIYLQPYWQPDFLRRGGGDGKIETRKPKEREASFSRYRFSLPFPMAEMMGPYVGYAVTAPRLPNDGTGGYASSSALWSACESLTRQKK